jgi:hypothetical protein
MVFGFLRSWKFWLALIILSPLALAILYLIPQTTHLVMPIVAFAQDSFGGLISWFTATTFYQVYMSPHMFWFGAFFGAILMGISAYLIAHGYLSFIRLGSRKGAEIVGYQGAPQYRPATAPGTPQGEVIPPPEKEQPAT